MGDTDAAIKDYTAALEMAAKFIDAFINRGQSRQSQQNFDGAIADYDRAIGLKPNAGVYYARATVRQAKNDLNGALSDYSKAIELDPPLARATPTAA